MFGKLSVPLALGLLAISIVSLIALAKKLK
jgi:hypothetical protein